jgi:phospholipase C
LEPLRWKQACLAFLSLALLAVVAVATAGAAGTSRHGDQEKLRKIDHVVVIYEENHSFDILYGG